MLFNEPKWHSLRKILEAVPMATSGRKKKVKKSVAVFAKITMLFASLCIQSSFTFAQGNSAVTGDGPDQELKQIRLDDLEARLRTMKPGSERDYFAGVLANRAGRLQESIRLLNRVLPSMRMSRPDRAAVALLALADDYTKSYRYRDAAKARDDLLTHFSSQLGPVELKGEKDDMALAQILRDAPAQTITWDGAVRLKTERNPIHSQNVALTVNGVQGPWLLDTGANISVVSKSFAERLGLQFLEGAAQVQAGVTGIENPLHVALLPTLQMSGATLHHVVVLVLDDASLNINLGKQSYQINAIIGHPVFQALGRITFLHDGEFVAGNKTRAAARGARMYMNQLTPIIEGNVEGKNLPFGFDTGASETELFVRYYQRFQSEAKAWEMGETTDFGAGGSVKRKIYTQPEVNLGIGDKTVILKKIAVLTSGTGTSSLEDLYGNLGQDVVTNFESFTLDFSAMTFSLGDPRGVAATAQQPQAAASAPVAPTSKAAESLLNADRSLAAESHAIGFKAAYAKAMAPDARKLDGGQQPAIGRDSILALMARYPAGLSIDWTPEEAVVAESGELGFTWGRYVASARDSNGKLVVQYGKYLDVWKRQSADVWRWIADIGNDSPPPPGPSSVQNP
jgi:predicted aspartyl protease/ketosteroid isomerase-like protein